MIRDLIRRLGLDRLDEYLTDEIRRAKLAALQEERAVVEGLLDRIEGRLSEAAGSLKRGGRAAGATPTKRRRKGAPRFRRPGETLKDMVVKALNRVGGPVAVDKLLALVKKVGYKSAASLNSLKTSVYTALSDRKLFERVDAGIYRLAGKGKPQAAKAAAAKRAKPKRKAGAKAKTKKAARPKSQGGRKTATPRTVAQSAPETAPAATAPAPTEKK